MFAMWILSIILLGVQTNARPASKISPLNDNEVSVHTNSILETVDIYVIKIAGTNEIIYTGPDVGMARNFEKICAAIDAKPVSDGLENQENETTPVSFGSVKTATYRRSFVRSACSTTCLATSYNTKFGNSLAFPAVSEVTTVPAASQVWLTLANTPSADLHSSFKSYSSSQFFTYSPNSSMVSCQPDTLSAQAFTVHANFNPSIGHSNGSSSHSVNLTTITAESSTLSSLTVFTSTFIISVTSCPRLHPTVSSSYLEDAKVNIVPSKSVAGHLSISRTQSSALHSVGTPSTTWVRSTPDANSENSNHQSHFSSIIAFESKSRTRSSHFNSELLIIRPVVSSINFSSQLCSVEPLTINKATVHSSRLPKKASIFTFATNVQSLSASSNTAALSMIGTWSKPYTLPFNTILPYSLSSSAILSRASQSAIVSAMQPTVVSSNMIRSSARATTVQVSSPMPTENLLTTTARNSSMSSSTLLTTTSTATRSSKLLNSSTGESTSTSSSISSPSSTTKFATSRTVTHTSAIKSTTTSSGGLATPHIPGQGVLGIAYDAFKPPGPQCKSEPEIVMDIQQLISYGYESVRLYGVECSQIAAAIRAVQSSNAKLWLGIYSVENFRGELENLIKQVNGEWKSIARISIFNEAVYDNRATANQVIAVIKTSKLILARAGYSGDIGTCDTIGAIKSNPELCSGSTFIAGNIQPYYGGIAAEKSGDFLAEQYDMIKVACPHIKAYIGEAGFPSAGPQQGLAVPSIRNQNLAVTGMIAAANGRLVVFQAFNAFWKDNVPLPDVEQSFGLYKQLYKGT